MSSEPKNGAPTNLRPGAAVASLLIASGAGHFVLGRPRRALVWLLVEAGLAAACLQSILASRPRLFWGFIVAGVALRLAAVIDVLRRSPSSAPSRWRGALVVSLGLLALFVAKQMAVHQVESFHIPTASMSPAILVGDHVYVDKRLYLPQRGDIVAFSFPRRPGVLLKRVIAVAGDTVEIRNDVVYLNGQPLPRRHLDGDCHYPELAAGTWTQHPCDGWQETLDGVSYETVFETHRKPFSFPATKIPEDSFFVLGDNRDNSNDSRWKGAVPDRKLIGRALFVWLSQGEGGTRWSRIGTQLP